MNILLNAFFIFFARVSDVTLSTVRILMIMRGRSISAAIIGFAEVSIYVLALSRVIGSLESPILVVAYALGFSAGTLTGGLLEERLAIGYATAQIISLEQSRQITEQLREDGFGVTIIEGSGRAGTHEILHVLLKRKDIPDLLNLIKQADQQAFVSIMDTRKILGGYFRRIKAK
ncbi:MAG TPA: DUF2179 domain-containing protein [Oscillospiraceae bacterium]|nr:DUF2179 domain-containing protein [Oscillospiraceae bacterium]